jgi:hypothetical protein
MANIPKDELISITVTSLRAHWRNVKARLLRGYWEPAGPKGGFDYFEADTSAHQKILARRFYSLRHAEKILSLSDSKLKSNISYYAEIAAKRAWTEFPDMPEEQRDYMRSLAKYEYVLIQDDRVSAHPARVLYDDWYERSCGAMMNFSGYIMKSTGENFSKLEAEWLDASVRRNAWEDSAFWRTGSYPETANRIDVWIVELDRPEYLDGIGDGLWRGTKAQLIALLRYLRDECNHHDRETSMIERMLSKSKTTKKSDLLAGFWKMLRSDKTAEVYAVLTDDIVTSDWRIPPLTSAG